MTRDTEHCCFLVLAAKRFRTLTLEGKNKKINEIKRDRLRLQSIFAAEDRQQSNQLQPPPTGGGAAAAANKLMTHARKHLAEDDVPLALSR